MVGIIDLDTEFAKEIGFTSDKFQGYLWRVERSIYISVIRSLKPRQGNLTALFNAIRERGYQLKVPGPFPLMEYICRKKGFTRTVERDGVVVFVGGNL